MYVMRIFSVCACVYNMKCVYNTGTWTSNMMIRPAVGPTSTTTSTATTATGCDDADDDDSVSDVDVDADGRWWWWWWTSVGGWERSE